MLPLFTNASGFWLLLGIPAVVAIHFLQQRSRSMRMTTLFLLEQAAPESRSGRTWDRLRQSLALWCQILAILLATWVLVEPRWVRSESALTMVVVMDQSSSMRAFREPARRALRERIAAVQGLAERTTCILMTSDPRQLPLYRGASGDAALASLDAWKPSLGTHDLVPSLRLAHSLAGKQGLVWFITDSREGLPPDEAAVGVGRPLPNVGFAGATLLREEGRLSWRAFVQNRSEVEQRRAWWLESAGSRTQEKQLILAPGAMAELGGPLPEGAERCTVVLEADAYTLDDRLPLQRPQPKRLSVSVALEGGAAEFFRKLIPSVEGLRLAPAADARLKVARFIPLGERPPGPAILLAAAPKAAPDERLSLAPRIPARHPLMADLNWQSWLGLGAEEIRLVQGDTPLLWQADAPLIVLGSGNEDARSLLFNFNWDASNAHRLPSAVLLLRRFLEGVRDAQAGHYAANFDCASPVPLAARDLGNDAGAILEFQPAGEASATETRPVPAAELAILKAPLDPGFFVLKQGGTVLVQGAAQYADPREGDFAKAESFLVDNPRSLEAALQRNTRPDPFEKPALILLAAALLLSWTIFRRRTADSR